MHLNGFRVTRIIKKCWKILFYTNKTQNFLFTILMVSDFFIFTIKRAHWHTHVRSTLPMDYKWNEFYLLMCWLNITFSCLNLFQLCIIWCAFQTCASCCFIRFISNGDIFICNLSRFSQLLNNMMIAQLNARLSTYLGSWRYY